MSETPQWPQSARLRAGDADRQRTIERLTQSWRDGRLTRDEFQRRTQQSFEATFRDELDALTADLTGLAPISPEVPHDAPAVPLGAESVLAGRQPEYREVAARYAPAGASGSAVSVGFLSGMDKGSEGPMPSRYLFDDAVAAAAFSAELFRAAMKE